MNRKENKLKKTGLLLLASIFALWLVIGTQVMAASRALSDIAIPIEPFSGAHDNSSSFAIKTQALLHPSNLVAEMRKTAQKQDTKEQMLNVVGFFLLLLMIVAAIASILNLIKHSANWCLIRKLLALTFALGAAYIAVAVYFDISIGITSSSSRAGANVVASKDSEPLMFFLIIGGKALVGVLLLIFAKKTMSRSQDRSHSY